MTTQHPIVPPAAEIPPTPPVTPRRPTSGGRAIAITLTVIGGAAILFSLVSAILVGLRGQGVGDRTYSASATGITAVDLNASAADVEVRYGDVTEAELSVVALDGSGTREWVLRRDGDDLEVSQKGGWGWIGWFTLNDEAERVELVLPRALEGTIDFSSDISAGSTVVAGDYRAVELDLSAGSVQFTGGSTAMDVQVSAGEARVQTEGPDIVSIDVSAGKAIVSVAGTAPRTVDLGVSAGAIEITLPDDAYAVSQDVSAGSADIGVRTDPSSTYRLDVDVSAGDVTVRAGD